jgi:hypothetical protein
VPEARCAFADTSSAPVAEPAQLMSDQPSLWQEIRLHRARSPQSLGISSRTALHHKKGAEGGTSADHGGLVMV